MEIASPGTRNKKAARFPGRVGAFLDVEDIMQNERHAVKRIYRRRKNVAASVVREGQHGAENIRVVDSITAVILHLQRMRAGRHILANSGN